MVGSDQLVRVPRVIESVEGDDRSASLGQDRILRVL
jgi:hypothetical protein